MVWLQGFPTKEKSGKDLVGYLQLNSRNSISATYSRNLKLDPFQCLQNIPCFPLRGENIHVLHEPRQFYQTLLLRIATCKYRIALASLYIGTGEKENKLIQALRRRLECEPAIKINILLDFTRGTRGGQNSSKSMLAPLVRDFKDQIELSLYHTPHLRGFTKRWAPPKWNELLGLQHMKLYIFDDAVVISGANLSEDYFTNRQDRYILIEDKKLADFYVSLISAVQEFSLSVNEYSEVGLHRNWNVSPYNGCKNEFVLQANKRISDLMKKTYYQQQIIVNENRGADTWIFPLIEMGQLNIHYDSYLTKNILSALVNGSKIKLATGYFNLTDEYKNIIITNCVSKCSILMAHPHANGFQGAKGPAGAIPTAYSLIAKNFYLKLVRHKQDYRVSLFEYQRDKWTFHAKGLWYYDPSSSYPKLTLIGSSNFGERSVNRDLETQVCLLTENKRLSRCLEKEVNVLFNFGNAAEQDIIIRHVPRWVKIVVRIFRNFF